MSDSKTGDPATDNPATDNPLTYGRGLTGSVEELRTGIRERTLPIRILRGGPETARELYAPPDASKAVPATDVRTYALLPPFFDESWGARQWRVKAARDAFDQWGELTGGITKAINDEVFLGFQVLEVPDHFDSSHEDDPDYVDQYHVTLEHLLRNPPFLRMGAADIGAKAMARYLTVIFGKELVLHGKHVALGIYKVGSAVGSGGHHIFAKSAFPQWAWNRMLAISQEAMVLLKLDHGKMTRLQGALYRALYRRGTHTMKDHINIANAVLRAGGATRLQRRLIVAHALNNLRRMGIRQAVRIPTFGRPPKLPPN